MDASSVTFSFFLIFTGAAIFASIALYTRQPLIIAYIALGAAIAGRFADRLERPLLFFGLAEIGVGLAGLAVAPILFNLGPVEIWMHSALGGSGIPRRSVTARGLVDRLGDLVCRLPRF